MNIDDYIYLSVLIIMYGTFIYYQRKQYLRLKDIDKLLGYFYKKELTKKKD